MKKTTLQRGRVFRDEFGKLKIVENLQRYPDVGIEDEEVDYQDNDCENNDLSEKMNTIQIKRAQKTN